MRRTPRCERCWKPIELGEVGYCKLCALPYCADCLRDVGDGHPDGLLPGAYCATCLGEDR